MSTRSTIAIVNPDNTVRSIYCHWDGYPENNGRILNEHYTSPEKINELMDIGCISSLAPEVHPSPESEHSYESRQEGVVVAYGRDRGDEGTEAQSFVSEAEYRIDNDNQEYNYLYKDGVWRVARDEPVDTGNM